MKGVLLGNGFLSYYTDLPDGVFARRQETGDAKRPGFGPPDMTSGPTRRAMLSRVMNLSLDDDLAKVALMARLRKAGHQ
jgi:hypothetical protein